MVKDGRQWDGQRLAAHCQELPARRRQRHHAAGGEVQVASLSALAAAGCQQILSYPGEDFGFADAGMQPEGIAFCDQGVDEGLIAKGDTWGGLGWIYTAGTDGMRRYLRSLDDS